MAAAQTELQLPRSLQDVDAAFMTQVLRESGAIEPSNAVISQEEKGVGMTAGYFSAIKKIKCAYKEPTDAPRTFVVKAWPQMEIASREHIQSMFIKDIKGYQFPADQFYPRPKTHLCAYDVENNLWALVMEDADTFAEQKVHETPLRLDEVLRLIPGLVDVAVAWEGSGSGDKAQRLEELGVDHWASDHNLAIFKATMPGSAKFFDKLTTMAHSNLCGPRTWDTYLGAADFAQLFTRRIDAFLKPARPDQGATCTLSHGDLRGDNLFMCEPSSAFPGGWLCIDFQQMFRGPVPSDLAYLMTSGTVLPEVYTGENLNRILQAFYSQFMRKTQVYKDYSFEQFVDEYSMMSTVNLTYFLAFGVPFFEGGLRNETGLRVEFGDQGVTEADLPPEEQRQRIYWRQAFASHREHIKTLNLVERLRGLPESLEGLGKWSELPERLNATGSTALDA